MSDITKCTGEGCKKADRCYRVKAKDSEYQSYFGKPPFENNGRSCREFIDVNPPEGGKKRGKR